jgi:phosphoribosylformimino-5-aminoimidazole carboxamide ribonucleotide (ProFAR) isomerase
MAGYLELLPAVDVMSGQAVQVIQGVAWSKKGGRSDRAVI